MTVEDLISDYEDVEDLDVVYIDHSGYGHIYEDEDIDFIDGLTLGMTVNKHMFKTETRHNKTIRALYIKC